MIPYISSACKTSEISPARLRPTTDPQISITMPPKKSARFVRTTNTVTQHVTPSERDDDRGRPGEGVPIFVSNCVEIRRLDPGDVVSGSLHDLGFYGKKPWIRAGINANRRLYSRRTCPIIPAGLSLYSRRAVLLFPQSCPFIPAGLAQQPEQQMSVRRFCHVRQAANRRRSSSRTPQPQNSQNLRVLLPVARG
jgi:hypothetical protein